MPRSPFDNPTPTLHRLAESLHDQIVIHADVAQALTDLGEPSADRLARLNERRITALDAWSHHLQGTGTLQRHQRALRTWADAANAWFSEIRATLHAATLRGDDPAAIAHVRAALPPETRSILRATAVARDLAQALVATAPALATAPGFPAAVRAATQHVAALEPLEAAAQTSELADRQARAREHTARAALADELRSLVAEWRLACLRNPDLPTPDLRVAQQEPDGRDREGSGRSRGGSGRSSVGSGSSSGGSGRSSVGSGSSEGES